MSGKSDVWKHFVKKGADKVVCNICSAELSYKTSTTGSMINHLRNKHSTTRMQNTKNQPTIPNMFSQSQPRRCDRNRSEEVTKRIVNLIVKNLLPVSIVETDAFRELVNFSEPEYEMPSRKTIQARINLCYNRKKEEIKNILSKSDAVSLTTDSWTSINMDSYSTVTAHYIENWALKNNVLATVYHAESHTADNLQHTLTAVCEQYGIVEKIFGCVHDNAANIVLACRNLDFVKFNGSCAAHTIQLAINKGFDETPLFKKTIAACSKLVGHFKHSYAATNYLKEKQALQDLPQHKLIQRCSTRWNSTYDMFERISEQRWAVTAVLSDRTMTKINDARVLELRDDHWILIEESLPALKPLKIATTAVSSEESVSFSSIVPIIISLINNHLSPKNDESAVLKSFKTVVGRELKTRFSYLCF